MGKTYYNMIVRFCTLYAISPSLYAILPHKNNHTPAVYWGPIEPSWFPLIYLWMEVWNHLQWLYFFIKLSSQRFPTYYYFIYCWYCRIDLSTYNVRYHIFMKFLVVLICQLFYSTVFYSIKFQWFKFKYCFTIVETVLW